MHRNGLLRIILTTNDLKLKLKVFLKLGNCCIYPVCLSYVLFHTSFDSYGRFLVRLGVVYC